MTDTALVDVDGTLVDSNYHHVLAWQRAFRDHDRTVAGYLLHRHLGMGGDQLVAAVAGDEVEHACGDELRAAWRRHADALLPEVQAVDGALDLLRALRDRGLAVVLASSGAAEHVEHYVDLVGAREVASAWTTADDVGTTKPSPELLEVALRKVGGTSAVTLGDSTWDGEASRRLGAPSYAVLTGGFSPAELEKAGARQVFATLPELTDAVRGGRIEV